MIWAICENSGLALQMFDQTHLFKIVNKLKFDIDSVI